MKKGIPLILVPVIVIINSCGKDNIQIQSDNLLENGTAVIQSAEWIITRYAPSCLIWLIHCIMLM